MFCSKTILSLDSGRQALNTDNVAGVYCAHNEPTTEPTPTATPTEKPTRIIPQCTPYGSIRLQGSQEEGTGRLEYCYNGYWAAFCKLDTTAASVACKQLGFSSYTG